MASKSKSEQSRPDGGVNQMPTNANGECLPDRIEKYLSECGPSFWIGLAGLSFLFGAAIRLANG